MTPFKLLRFPNPLVELRNILMKSMEIGVVAKNRLQPPKTMFLPQINLKLQSKSSKSLIRFNIYYVIRIPFPCHLYALVF